MTKKLTFSEATLGWRFAHTKIFLQNFIKQIELLEDVQIKNLDEYWNIMEATGLWLRQLGNIFHLDRPSALYGDQFVLNVDHLNDNSVVLNGHIADITDALFRSLIVLRSISTMKLVSMKNIAENISAAFDPNVVKVEFRENTDRLGNFKERYFRIIITFRDALTLKMFMGLQLLQPLLLVGKPMGVSYEIFYELNPNL